MGFGTVVGRKRKGLPRILNLYSFSSKEDLWIEGNSAGSGSVSKNADHLHCETSGNLASVAERTWVQESAVDLTDYSTLHVDWEATLADDTSCFARLVASTDRDSGSGTFDARLSVRGSDEGGAFARREESVSVSSLSGDHFIRVHAVDNSATSSRDASVLAYRIWLEQ